MADADSGTPARITARSFPTPDIVKTTNNPALWDQLGGFAAVQAAEANAALAVLDGRLASAATTDERVAAFESAYRHVADWRYQVAVQGQWTRPGAYAEDVRTPITTAAGYRLTPTVAQLQQGWLGGFAGVLGVPAAGDREPGSPAFRMLTELERTALDRLNGSDRLQNVVVLRDGSRRNGNLLLRDGSEVQTWTAAREDREVLRRASVEVLADLETQRAEAGRLDPHDPQLRQEYADAAYFLVQGPEVRRGSDAIMRTFLVAAHTRVFDAAPVLPQAIDLDGMVRGQEAFGQVMREQLRMTSHSADPGRAPDAVSADKGERAGDRHINAARRSGEIAR